MHVAHLICTDEAQQIQPAGLSKGRSSWSDGSSRSQRRCCHTPFRNHHCAEAATGGKDTETGRAIGTVAERHPEGHIRLLLEYAKMVGRILNAVHAHAS